MTRHVHLIGIGGSGLSAIARLLLENGYQVSGSDQQASPLTRQLRDLGAQVYLGHEPGQIAGAQVVVRSSAIPDENVEVVAARSAGLPVLKRAEFLQELIGDRQAIAVAGTHGKTTTTGMIAWLLTELGQDPSFLVGGVLANLGTNAHAGQGRHFVIEADEYDHMFLGLRPSLAIVTNVEYDHPDFFASADEFFRAFVGFTRRVQPGGALLACLDDPGAARLLHQQETKEVRVHTYGIQGDPDYKAQGLHADSAGGVIFNLLRTGSPLLRVRLRIPGAHNVRNALAALAVVDQLDLDVAAAVAALEDFRGAGRRFELRGEVGGITVVDDYAHHPTEIEVTLGAAREAFSARPLWAVWQPHTYTRTQAFAQGFQAAFGHADHVLVMDVFAAREAPDGAFSLKDLVAGMQHPAARYVTPRSAVVATLLKDVEPGSVVLVLSAGDGDQISTEYLLGLRERSQQHV